MTAIDPQRLQDAAELQVAMGPRAAAGGDAAALFALGFAAADCAPFAREIAAETPVLLADCYGILGFSATAGRNPVEPDAVTRPGGGGPAAAAGRPASSAGAGEWVGGIRRSITLGDTGAWIPCG